MRSRSDAPTKPWRLNTGRRELDDALAGALALGRGRADHLGSSGHSRRKPTGRSDCGPVSGARYVGVERVRARVPSAGDVRPLRLGLLADDPRRALPRRGGADRASTEPNYNVTPRAEVPVVAESKGKRVLDLVRWGLVPSWAKSISVGDRMINARAETLLDEQRVQAAVRAAGAASSRPTASTSGRRSRAARR